MHINRDKIDKKRLTYMQRNKPKRNGTTMTTTTIIQSIQLEGEPRIRSSNSGKSLITNRFGYGS